MTLNDTTLNIGYRQVGPGRPVYVIAELSANHHHDLGRAVEIVRAAAAAGADAVKVQTYTADTMTIDSDRPPFRIEGTLWDGRTLYDLYREAHLPWEWHAPLQRAAVEAGLDFFSSPFDASAVAFLDDLGVPAYKIASFENVDLPLIRRVARTGRPVILSTGMATLDEVAEAVETFRQAGGSELALLKGASAYPAPLDQMNLRAIRTLADTFGVAVGLSDHTLGTEAPAAAVALGASVIEKHLTLSRDEPGPDSAFSLEPGEFRAMVDAVRATEAMLGSPEVRRTAKEEGSLAFRRSLFVVEDVAAGELFTTSNVRAIRPGDGLHTRHIDEVLGRAAAVDIERGTPLAWSFVEGGEPVPDTRAPERAASPATA